MKTFFTLCIMLFFMPGISSAETWKFEDDPACELFGCVIVHNGQDARIYLLNGAPGTPAEFYAGRESENIRSIESGNNGNAGAFMLGIDTTGDGKVNIRASDLNNSGFLDAGDYLQGFQLTPLTNPALASRRIKHSYRIASNARFALYARLNRFEAAEHIKQSLTPEKISFQMNVHTNLEKDQNTSLPGNVRKTPGISTLADIQAIPVKTAEFDPITSAGADLRQSSLYIINTYEFPGYSLADGYGSINMEINYIIYNP
ncbi:EF-Hand-containing [Desulfonema limicola]|uniref:EF-Hand-containing n=1 Tax=Desulfonema limicola TaxID=45656 RepID=A0A975B392_9BACT|nr:hypothetical protein [Desulfonema limicola]QTA77988.1 EF-Hand-containing [Desulfonema limicola]